MHIRTFLEHKSEENDKVSKDEDLQPDGVRSHKVTPSESLDKRVETNYQMTGQRKFWI